MSAISVVTDHFDVGSLVPPAIASDVATAAAYYDTFTKATGAISLGKNGTIQMSDAAATATLDTMIGVMQFVPVLGQAFAVLMALAPSAGAGPGVCSTDPPHVADRKRPTPSELAAWPHHTSWETFHGPYPRGAAGSFEAYANPVLAWNWELAANCFLDLYVPSPILLATLITSWNAMHAGTSSRTITRTGLNPAGFGSSPNDDPIAEALESAVVAKAAAGAPPSTSWAAAEAASAAAPHNVTSSFVVHAGKAIAPAAKAPAPALDAYGHPRMPGVRYTAAGMLDFSNLAGLDLSQAGAAAVAAAAAARPVAKAAAAAPTSRAPAKAATPPAAGSKAKAALTGLGIAATLAAIAAKVLLH